MTEESDRASLKEATQGHPENTGIFLSVSWMGSGSLWPWEGLGRSCRGFWT